MLFQNSSSETHSVQFIQNQPFTCPRPDKRENMEAEAGNHSQFITNITTTREFEMMDQWVDGTIFFDTHMPYTNSIVVPIPAKEIDESGLTCNNNRRHNMGKTSSRKRSREYYYQTTNESRCNNKDVGKPMSSSSWLEHEAALHLQRRQRELDCLITQHTQRLRVELKERAKSLASAIREAVSTKLREKEAEIQRVGKMNRALQERIRNLSVENQLWRGMAQSNEAAANSLRTDLERVLTVAVEDQMNSEEDDAESCCGSNEVKAEEERRRRCKGCGGLSDEGVVVMPCRHVLLMCPRCKSSSRHSCPVCRSSITTTLHVHLPQNQIVVS